MRKKLIAEYLSLLILLTCPLSGNAQIQASFSDFTFWTCSAPPAPPANAPADIAGLLQHIQAVSPNQTMGRWFIASFSDLFGNIPPGTVAVQNIDLKGFDAYTKNECGDDTKPFAFKVTEYFKTPVVDFQAHFDAICEKTHRRELKAQVAFLAKPAGAPQIPAGQNAAFIPDRGMALFAQVEQNAGLNWGFVSEYDACHPSAPETTCQKVHCLNIWKQPELGEIENLDPKSHD